MAVFALHTHRAWILAWDISWISLKDPILPVLGIPPPVVGQSPAGLRWACSSGQEGPWGGRAEVQAGAPCTSSKAGSTPPKPRRLAWFEKCVLLLVLSFMIRFLLQQNKKMDLCSVAVCYPSARVPIHPRRHICPVHWPVDAAVSVIFCRKGATAPGAFPKGFLLC